MNAVADIMNKPVINEKVVEQWQQLASDRRTVAFCSTIQHATDVMLAFKESGVSCDMITGELPKHERRSILKAYANGEIRVLVNVAVLTEGWDDPPTSCVILLRPSSYKSTYLQMVGRGLRTVNPDEHPGIVKSDCVAEGQRVLTDRGLIPIEHVTRAMKVWDGVDFVDHSGIVFRGEKEVISYAGLTATTDHKVWTANGWQAFGDTARARTPILVTGDGWHAVRQAEDRFRGGGEDWAEEEAKPSDGMHGMWCPVAEGLPLSEPGLGWLPEVRKPEASSEVVGGASGRGKRALHKLETYELSTIWSKGHQVSIRESDRDGGVGPRESWAAQGAGDRPNQQRWELRAGQPSLDFETSQWIEQKDEETNSKYACVQREISRDSLRGCDVDQTDWPRPDIRRDSRSLDDCTITQAKRRVWDILNAGPRHRFTCEGLLVSNCIILDFGRSTLAHGSLEQTPDLAQEMACPSCGFVHPKSVNPCPSCGFNRAPDMGETEEEATDPEEIDDEEEEIATSDFVMTEIDLMARSAWRWIDPWDNGDALMASGFEAWVGIFWLGGTWYAIGGQSLKDGGRRAVKYLGSGERIVALAISEDFLNDHETDGSSAHKSKRWLKDPASDKQLVLIGERPGAMISKYQAACLINFKFNRGRILQLIQSANAQSSIAA